MMTEPTKAQKMRQQTRDNGRYRNYYHCEICGKTIKNNEYYSDPRCNSHGGNGQILCEKDAEKLAKFSDAAFDAVFTMIDALKKKTE